MLYEFAHTGAKWRNSNKTGDPGDFFFFTSSRILRESDAWNVKLNGIRFAINLGRMAMMSTFLKKCLHFSERFIVIRE